MKANNVINLYHPEGVIIEQENQAEAVASVLSEIYNSEDNPLRDGIIDNLQEYLKNSKFNDSTNLLLMLLGSNGESILFPSTNVQFYLNGINGGDDGQHFVLTSGHNAVQKGFHIANIDDVGLELDESFTHRHNKTKIHITEVDGTKWELMTLAAWKDLHAEKYGDEEPCLIAKGTEEYAYANPTYGEMEESVKNFNKNLFNWF